MSLDPTSFDQLAATLSQTRPVLDDDMDERVRARLTEALRNDAQLRIRRSHAWRLRLFTFAAAAAVVIAFLWWTERLDFRRTREEAASPSSAHAEFPPAPAEPPLDPAKLREDSIGLLRACLRDEDPIVRMRAADALADIGDDAMVRPLATMAEGDPDPEVRGHAAEALGKLQAHSTIPLLAKLEREAPAPLKVWYASALARLGEQGAVRRLIRYAANDDLAVSFKATLVLAENSPTGDPRAFAALARMASREKELNQVVPYAGIIVLAKMSALGYPKAFDLLVTYLESSDETIRLAAAESLARIEEDAGRAVLHDISSNRDSPNRLVAAVAQISLGDFSGRGVMEEHLEAKTPGMRQLAARGLGEIGDPECLSILLKVTREDSDWAVRIAAAVAIQKITRDLRTTPPANR